MNQDRRGERESGESEPHFSGLPTEGSHSEMAFGPLTRLEPLLVDARAEEHARCARLPGVRTTTAGDRYHARGRVSIIEMASGLRARRETITTVCGFPSV